MPLRFNRLRECFRLRVMVPKMHRVLPRLIDLHSRKQHVGFEHEVNRLSIGELNFAIADLKSRGNVGGGELDVHLYEDLLQLLTGAKFIKEAELKKIKK